MNELALQKLIVDAVNGAGGYAYKCNNRFLIGVADLFVKLPFRTNGPSGNNITNNPPGGFLEVKQRAMPGTSAFVSLDVTAPQRKFLHEASLAGVPCGVASFLQSGTGSGLKLWLWVRAWRPEWRVPTAAISASIIDHLSLGKPHERANILLTHLYEWQREWRK